jgi:S1-C subfamily serine protease
VWRRAGLHTGDRLLSWNGAAVNDVPQFRAALNLLRVGDTVRVRVARDSVTFEKTIAIAGYDRPTVRIEQRGDATQAQRRLAVQWLAGR